VLILDEFVPDLDCTVWARLSDAGVVLLGNLNLKTSLFRKPALLRFARRATLEFFQLVAHLTQALAKFVGLDAHSSFASDAYEMSLGMLLELVHQDRIQMPALRARDIDGFIFEHT
jgi:hypothetical protein